MATKKGSKSSKTAHVLNVLSGPKADGEEMREAMPEEQPSLDAETEQPKEETAAAPAPPVNRPPVRAPILEMVRASDDALAEQIAGLLEQEMEDEFPSEPSLEQVQKVQGGYEAMPASQTDEEIDDVRMPLLDTPASSQDAQSSQPNRGVAAPEENTVAEDSGAVEAAPDEATVETMPMVEETTEEVTPAAVAEQVLPVETEPEESAVEVAPEVAKAESASTPAPIPEQPAKQAQGDGMAEYPTPQKIIEMDDFCHVNVMQALVDEKCMKYIKMFGLCDCSRCVADVKALALTSLPSKYLVMHKGEVIPMLTVYEGRFSTAVTAQLINACKVVMDHPRHVKD